MLIDFLGKHFVETLYANTDFCELLPDKKLSVLRRGEMPSVNGNVIVQGDNLQALKTLLPHFAGRVNCVYIDPPYNTGNEGWAYNDRVNSPMMRDWLEKKVDREDLSRHDKWCCMMYPRLMVLHELLAPNGVIFVSVDDNEQHHLRMMMDEIFGEHNFICTLVWEGTGKNDSRFVSVGHDYVHCYANDLDELKYKDVRWRAPKQGLDKIYKQVELLKEQFGADYDAISDGLSAWFKSLPKNDPSWQHRHYDMVDENGVFFPGGISWPGGGGPTYEVLHPVTKKPVKLPQAGWRFSKPEKMRQAMAEGRVHFGADHTSVPTLKRYLHETEVQVLNSVIYKDRRGAAQQLRTLMSGDVFAYPKDVQVLKTLIGMVTDKDAIVLDSFAGSGTTAQAVLELNHEDGGNRRFVLVECEDYANSVTAERVRRVIKGVATAKSPALQAGLDGDFSFWRLGEALELKTILTGDSLPPHDELAAYLFFKATGEVWGGMPKNPKRNFIGATSRYEVYLHYRPSVDYLMQTGLTLEMVAEFPVKTKKERLIFAPINYVEASDLIRCNVQFCQLPYQIFAKAGELASKQAEARAREQTA